jgi:glutathione S-transferase
MVLKLYHGTLGGMSLRASVILIELKIPFEFVMIDVMPPSEAKLPDHFKRHPFGLLPVLVRAQFSLLMQAMV